MLRFGMDVSLADTAERTIEGTLIPYGQTARVAGKLYRFLPGSVRMARSRMPLLVDHDRGRPVGVLAELTESESGALGRFKVDATAAGDEALVQAASGSRGELSIGAELEETADVDGVIEVSAAAVVETSLLALGAFEGATVTRVAAEADEPELEPEPNPDQTELPVEEPDPPPAPPASNPEEGTEMTEATAAPPMIIAERSPAARELNAGELVQLIVRAQHGDRDAGRYLEAALVESVSTDVSGLLPPSYERTVMGSKTVPRPLYNLFRSRPLPGVGLAVNKPNWITRPDGAWAATIDADATSNKVAIGSQPANVERWDWAGAIPWVVVQRSDPGIVDEIYSEAIEDFHLDVETRIAALLVASAAGTADTIGAGIAEFFTATGGRTPEVIIVAPDVWGTMADAKQLDSVVGAGDSTTATGELSATFAGIRITASGSLPAGSRYLATRRSLDARTTEPVRLTANAIGALNVELAVVGEGLFDTDYPGEILELAAPVVVP